MALMEIVVTVLARYGVRSDAVVMQVGFLTGRCTCGAGYGPTGCNEGGGMCEGQAEERLEKYDPEYDRLLNSEGTVPSLSLYVEADPKRFRAIFGDSDPRREEARFEIQRRAVEQGLLGGVYHLWIV